MGTLGLLKRACIACALCVATAIASHGQTLTTLHSFDGTDGSSPNAAVVQGTDGNFYGTTVYGGANATCSPDSDTTCGTVFQITPAGTLTTLHSFNGTDGSSPDAALVQGTDGKFYGTTSRGGAGADCTGSCGTIFTLVPDGTPVTLYNFCSQADCADGYGPVAGLVQGIDGNFYGTTSEYAQPDACLISDCGTVFKITSAGTLTTLYAFPTSGTITGGPGPGYGPAAGLVQGSDGNFYGTTEYGGNSNCGIDEPLYCGTIFKITPEGTLTMLYSFCEQDGCPDGSYPSGLVQGNDRNFYGSAGGGGGGGYGTIFKITPTGTLTTLHIFNGTDGAGPFGVVQGTDGNFYGATGGGGASATCPVGCGTLFKMTPAGMLITLYSFDGTDGSEPLAGLVQATNGTFYGTTYSGGANKDGTVFSFAIGMGGTAASTTSLGLSPASVTIGSAGPVVMTVTVAPASGSGTPTGVVAFYNGSNEVGIANLTGGIATFNYNPSGLAVNTYQITAIYSGDGTFAISTSSVETLTVAVQVLRTAATPTLSHAPGTYSSAQTVTITDTTTGAAIYFTNDGTTPTTSSAIYGAPITVNSTETINAIAAASGYSNSAVATATYTISLSPDYQLSVSPSTLTIAAGQSGTAIFTVTPVNGFNSQVSFTCSGLPSEATCSYFPSSVTPSGGTPVSSTLTISTTATSAAWRGPNIAHYLTYALLLPCFGMIFNFAACPTQLLRGSRVLGMLALVVLAAGLTSCGSSSNGGNSGSSGTPAGTSTVTLTASTSGTGAINHTATLKITITQ